MVLQNRLHEKKLFNKQDLMEEKHCRRMNTIQYDNGCIGSRIMAMIQGLNFFFSSKYFTHRRMTPICTPVLAQ